MRRQYLSPTSSVPGSGELGGPAYLPRGQAHPGCAHCDAPLLPFLRLELPKSAQAPAQVLSVLMCAGHNEIPCFEPWRQLPPAYWDQAEGHWRAYLVEAGTGHESEGPACLQRQPMAWTAEPAADANGCIAVGGEPQWLQDPEAFTCACGAPMHFVAQVSDSYRFAQTPEAPEQPDGPYVDGYVLFLGNEVYIFACSARCDPRAVWITVQN
jgi:hypothetical protein